MRVRVSASSVLEEYLPSSDSEGASENEGNTVAIDVPAKSNLLEVVEAAGIPADLAPLISLNGVVIPRSRHAEQSVSEDDHLHFMPNLKGG